jgi:tRNA U38,U39,U40 pseudouridine synthase TruA
MRHSLAFLFGYTGLDGSLVEDDDDDDDNDDSRDKLITSSAQVAGTQLQTALLDLLQELIMETSLHVANATISSSTPPQVELLSSTQSSIAKLRHRALSQDADCAAARDVMIVHLKAPKWMSGKVWNDIFERVRDRLRQPQQPMGTSVQVSLVAMKVVEPESGFSNAERSCTQRVYHYLLPLRWLPDGDELQNWWRSGDRIAIQHGPSLQNVEQAPTSMRRLKDVLRSAECAKLSPVEIQQAVAAVAAAARGAVNPPSPPGQPPQQQPPRKVASSRFGALGTRVRRPWHSYADPSLQGDASPNNEPVWRVVDRVRIVDFLQASSCTNPDGSTSSTGSPEDGEVLAVLEIKGDDFLPQQVRRIVGTAIAMAHDWLPCDFMETSTRADTIVETVLAPAGRIYVADTRFHFQEIRTKGKSLFTTDMDGDVVGGEEVDAPSSIEWVQTKLLERTSSASVVAAEQTWLEDLKTTVSPRIRAQLEKYELAKLPSSSRRAETELLGSCPEEFLPVLSQLRQISATGRWPETSAARSSVVRNLDKSPDSDVRTNGSFTVINPNFHPAESTTPPLGNELFPDLVKAIFELEMRLSKPTDDGVVAGDKLETSVATRGRSSSHCAVNCNAQFTPHVDSGTGAGQSLSMIVGLGDYYEGELFVERDLFDIRYKPLEFDGWKLRHWTNNFEGERYSLVWFTPELGGKSKKGRNKP